MWAVGDSAVNGGHSELEQSSVMEVRVEGISVRRAQLCGVELGPLVILPQIRKLPGGSIWSRLSPDWSEV